MSPAPDVSVVVVNWNTRELTLRCLDSIPTGLGGGITHETIVVENASVDGSADALRDRNDIVLVENDANLGFAQAVNQAYRKSSGGLVLLLNSDVELPPGSVGVLVRFLQDRPDVAGAAPLYRYPDGRYQPFHFRFPSFMTTLANGSRLVRRLPGAERRLRSYRMLDDDFSAPRPVPQPSASCLLLRRTCLEASSVFDERFPIFFNDVQLARSLERRGEQLWVVPESVVLHEQSASTGKMGPTLKRHYLGSLIRMLQDTEPAYLVWAYRGVVLAQGLVLFAVRADDAIPPRQLWRALTGNPGPLPRLPA